MSVITIEDVADKAGVCAATVDRIIHNRGKSRPSTVAKVKEAIDALGYRPNMAASMLARGKVRRIGLVISDQDVEFLKDLALRAVALEDELKSSGVSIEVFRCDETSPSVYAESFEKFAKNMDACAVLAPNDPAIVDVITRLESQGVRIATIVSEIPTSARSLFVGPNNQDLGATAASLLLPTLERQEGQVVVLKPVALQEDHEARDLGFRLALQAAGIDPLRIRTLVLPFESNQTNVAQRIAEELAGYPLLGAYMTGGWLRAQMSALANIREKRPVTVATDLTEFSRKFLLSKELDFVVATDVQDMIHTAFNRLIRKLNEPLWEPRDSFQPVQIFTRFNMPINMAVSANGRE